MNEHKVISRKKLIEVALPLDAINKASAREKSIRHGHPSTLHLWWARRPLATARAVIFAQMVDDPSEYVDELFENPKTLEQAEILLEKRLQLWTHSDIESETETDSEVGKNKPTIEQALADVERQRLFTIIEDLVIWQNSLDENVLEPARAEIHKSWMRTCKDNANHPDAERLFNEDDLPAFHDPFAGGGAIPLEAQRLGFRSYASDLNPIAVSINKAMIEVPPKFANMPPVNEKAQGANVYQNDLWGGNSGLAEDIRYYGEWMREEAYQRIGHLYSKVEITPEIVKERPDLASYLGRELTVIAWLWTRTVRSPNPAFYDTDVPLISSFILSSVKGKEAYVEPAVYKNNYHFEVKSGIPQDIKKAKLGTSAGARRAFKCLLSGAPISYNYIQEEGKSGNLKERLLAIVLEGNRERVYLAPKYITLPEVDSSTPSWKPETKIPNVPRDFRTQNYGLTTFGDLFTTRQLIALNTFTDLISEVTEKVKQDFEKQRYAISSTKQDAPLIESDDYAKAIAFYLSLVVSKCSDYWSSVCSWHSSGQKIRNTFGRQAIPMVWDFAETNPFSHSTGNWSAMLAWVWKVVEKLPSGSPGLAVQADAQTQSISKEKIISTDPPYYDNIGYADLSDFFYVWLRRMLHPLFPEIFPTLATPKTEELIAAPHRHGGKEDAESFFLDGMTLAMRRIGETALPGFPVTIYYAFKQAETRGAEGTASTGWEVFLEAVIRAGLSINGTWPVRTEMSSRMVGTSANVLASSVVLVCRARQANAVATTRREFINQLKSSLPAALRDLQQGGIAPVDLAQAAIGPGMAVYTGYSKVVDAEGNSVTVRDALALINQVLDEALSEQEGDFDAHSRWALAWFEQHAFNSGDYGIAETLSKAKNVGLSTLTSSGLINTSPGKVQLVAPHDLSTSWEPTPSSPIWEVVHQLIRALETHGEEAAAEALKKAGPMADLARDLAYRLYNICERKGWSKEAQSYNALVLSWPEIQRLAQQINSQKIGEEQSIF